MIHLSRDLAERTRSAIEKAQRDASLGVPEVPPVKVARSTKPELGDYSTPIAYQLAKKARMRPDEIARTLVKNFPAAEYLARVESVAGYINFWLADDWVQQQVNTILKLGNNYGKSNAFVGKRAQVECVSANPTGPITVGRIRGGVIGDTVARLLRAVGYDVQLEYYYNDAGAQIDRLGETLRARYHQRLGRRTRIPHGGYKGQYLYRLADELVEKHGDTLLDSGDLNIFKSFAVSRISDEQRESLERIGIRFNSYFSEQSLYRSGAIDRTLARLKQADLVYSALVPDRLEGHDQRPDAEEREAVARGPALWLRMTRIRGATKDCALVKSTGEPTYRLPDIAYHIDKLERGFDLAVNILGADHIEEAKDVKAAVGALGYDQERIQHIIHQFVNLVKRGTVQKMSTRKGEYVTLDRLVSQVGADAVRYFMLARSPDSRIDFDLDLARKRSNDNPVYYIQNAHVRCASIARVASERGAAPEGGDVTLLIDPRELALVRKLLEFPELVEQSAVELAPHKLAFWTHEELARLFHPIYEEIRALHGDVPEPLSRARLKLYAATKIVLENALGLLGMTAPEVM